MRSLAWNMHVKSHLGQSASRFLAEGSLALTHTRRTCPAAAVLASWKVARLVGSGFFAPCDLVHMRHPRAELKDPQLASA